MSERRVDEQTGVETTGHSYDGIEELNNPLPRWWLWTFYATIVWSLGYVIAYPAWPMITEATSGVLGYSSRGEVAAEIQAQAERNAPLDEALLAAELAEVAPGSDIHRYAVSKGSAVFRSHCSQCHGSGAAGAVGYPNLLDDDWLWGGTPEEIVHTVAYGIRNEDGDDPRYSEMPAFGELLEEEEIDVLTDYVLALSTGAEGTEAGAELFADNCSSCHGDEGLGDYAVGAPNLADAIWLYGGERKAVEHSIRYARYGVMPAWGLRLTEAEVTAVSLYVHQLGGGE